MLTMFDKHNIRTFNLNGLSHGTVSARIDDTDNFEITTLRIDQNTDGRHATVEFTTDWYLDSSRRDLTVNSMFLTMDGEVIDYHNGLEDLRNHRVRFVGNPVDRVREDYLRILRYFRFYGRLAKTPDSCHDEVTLQAIMDNVEGLSGISGERLWMEFKKILTGRFAPYIVNRMSQLNVLKYLGFLGDSSKINIDEFRSLWYHLESMEPHHATCLASLLTSEEQVSDILERMKISNEELSLLKFILSHRDSSKSDTCIGTYQDLFQLNPGKLTQLRMKITELLKYCHHVDTLRQFEQWNPPKFPVNGKVLIDQWKLAELVQNYRGPILGKILDQLRLEWSASKYQATAEELMTEDIKNRVLPPILERMKQVKGSNKASKKQKLQI